jgi:hypothetical protein
MLRGDEKLRAIAKTGTKSKSKAPISCVAKMISLISEWSAEA